MRSDGWGFPWLPLTVVILVIEVYGANTFSFSFHFVLDF